jgi:hypothetical protein
MIPVQCVSTVNEDWKYHTRLPDVPFPGDEIMCGSWGPMRVIRRSYLCADDHDIAAEVDDRRNGHFVGVILWVREEQAS